MFQSFSQIEKYVLDNKVIKKIALAGSHDPDALSSVVSAKRKGVITACLIGDVEKTRELLKQMNEPEEGYQFIHEPVGALAAHIACGMVKAGEADMPMKGKMITADFVRAVLDKQYEFISPGGLLCQATVLEFTEENRFMIISDCAVNVEPDYAAKKIILQNAVSLAHKLGISCPKVAVIAPLELVNPKIQATIDAALLSKAADRGQITGCIVDGPLAVDNAVSAEAAEAKGIGGTVAGHADILIMPDLCAGNAFTKSLHYFAHLHQSGCVTGVNIPIVMTSRTDSPEDKYYSILVAMMQSL